MKSIIKICLFFLIANSSHLSYSQISQDMIKYWYYRNRLNNYFVVPGEKQGESQVICVRNKIWADNDIDINHPQVHQDSKNVDYGQHGKYQGLYLGVLATEYYLLNKNGQYEDAAKTLNELHLALNAVKVWWDEAAEEYWEAYYVENYPNHYNGFFIRGNVPCDFFSEALQNTNGYTATGESHVELLNKGLTSENTWQGHDNIDETYVFKDLPRGHPGYADHRTCDTCSGQAINSAVPLHDYIGDDTNPNHPHKFHPETMSKDEAIWIILGCQLTIKLVGGNVGSFALTMRNKIVEFLVNTQSIYGTTPYRIYEPGGYRIPDGEGGSSFMYAKPLNLILGVPPTYYDNWIWAVLSYGPLGDGDLTAILAAITDSWLMNGAGIINVTAYYDWETFYVLLWEVLHNESLPNNKQNTLEEKALNQMNAAPCEGPYCYKADDRNYVFQGQNNSWILSGYDDDGIYAGDETCFWNSGWSGTYKWCSDRSCQYHGSPYTGNYNGTDYMLLYNLYHIKEYDHCPYYCNYTDKKLQGYMPKNHGGFLSWGVYGSNSNPIKYTAFNSISSTQTIGVQAQPVPTNTNDPGNVTYVAETEIHLKPGFHAMQGCYFHAYINNIDCSGEERSGRSMQDTNYFSSIYTPLDDSLMSLPKTPFVTRIEDTTKRNDVFILPCPHDTLRFMGMNGDTTEFDYLYYWDFGNGVTSTRKDPKVFYSPGAYNFTLVLTDTTHITDTIYIINRDTIHLTIEVPDCDSTIRGTLTENPDCGGNPVVFDSIWLVDANDSIVPGVTPVITDSLGKFWFALSELSTLDTNAVFALRSGNNFTLDDTSHHTVAQWLSMSPLSLQIVDKLKKEWVENYSGAADSAMVCSKTIDVNDNVFVLAKIYTDSTNMDYLTLKYNPQGNLSWAKRQNQSANSMDIPSVIASDLSGNVIISGTTSMANTNYLTLKYNSNGELLWSDSYDNSGNNSSADVATGVETDSLGNIYVSGYSTDINNNKKIVSIKYNANGQKQWIRDYAIGNYYGNSIDMLVASTLDNTGNMIIASTYKDSIGDNKYLVLKYGKSGDLLWAAKKNPTALQADIANDVTTDLSGNIIVTGNAGTYKFDSSGVYLWYSNGDYNKILSDDLGDVFVMNHQSGNISKLAAASGAVLWNNGSINAIDLALDKNNDLYVATNNDITKLNTDGVLIANVSLNNEVVGVCVSSNLNLYATGNLTYTSGGRRVTEIVTEKYSQCPSLAQLRSMSHSSTNVVYTNSQTQDKPFRIVPNPNNGEMWLQADNPIAEGSVFTIIDISGRLLYSKVISNEYNNIAISTSNLQNGVYLYCIYSPDGKLLMKDKLVIAK